MNQLLPISLTKRRRINFAQFIEALKQLAAKKFPGDEAALDKLKAKIMEGKGPIAHGVTVCCTIL